VRLEIEQELADVLEVIVAALELLGHRVDVAEAPLEGLAREHRRAAGRVIGEVGNLARLRDGVGGGQADPHALVEPERAAASDRAPDLLERGEQIYARGAKLRLGLRYARLGH